MNRHLNKFLNHLINSTDSLKELLAIYLTVVFGAALIFSVAEAKSFDDALWWAFVTALTVGYGDFVPVTLLGRVAAVVLMHIVPLLVIPLIVVRLLGALVRDENEFTHAEQQEMKADLAAIKKALKID